MATVVRRRWTNEATSGLPRRDRRACDYEAYLPDQLAGRKFRLEGSVAADVADAERAIQRLDTEAATLADTEALARLLLRAEAVASSHIEGLEVGGRRLLRAEAASEMGLPAEDITAEEVLGNIEAMRWALSHLATGAPVSVDGLLEAHRRLLKGTLLERFGGHVREVQNWIGGSSYNPCSAAFVPPPWEEVRPLLRDLCEFSSDEELPAVAQAAIAHAQFETVHPFVDGNGRVGRTLIHVILRRRGLARHVLPPVSLVLATRSKDYVAGLMATRYHGGPKSDVALEGINQWVGTFAGACVRAVEDALAFEERVRVIQELWRAKLGRVRRKSAVDLLIGALPGAPIVTVKGAATLIHRSFERTNEAIGRLAEAGIIRPVSVGRRNRAFEVPAIIDAFNDLERQLASPSGNTLTSPPSRPAPRRRSLQGGSSSDHEKTSARGGSDEDG